MLCCLLSALYLDLVPTLNLNLGPEGVPKSQNYQLLLAIIQGEKSLMFSQNYSRLFRKGPRKTTKVWIYVQVLVHLCTDHHENSVGEL